MRGLGLSVLAAASLSAVHARADRDAPEDGQYGIDQAFLRWRRSGPELDASEVWLGFFPTAAPRTASGPGSICRR